MIQVSLFKHQRYISPSPLTAHLLTNDRMYQKKCQLWHLRWTCYGQFYWTKLSGYHIHTYKSTILGTFKTLTLGHLSDSESERNQLQPSKSLVPSLYISTKVSRALPLEIGDSQLGVTVLLPNRSSLYSFPRKKYFLL